MLKFFPIHSHMLKESILDNINPRNDIFQRFFRFALTNDKIIESFKRICKKYYLDEIVVHGYFYNSYLTKYSFLHNAYCVSFA